MRSLEEHGIQPIDLVVSNLYPFRRISNRRGVPEAEVVENIDVGGPTMVRAAAKNFDSVAVVTDPERYGVPARGAAERGGELSPATRRDLAAEAFGTPPAMTRRSPAGSRTPSPSPTGSRSTGQGRRSCLRREPPSAGGLLCRSERPPPPALDGRAAGRPGALLQQPVRPEAARMVARLPGARCVIVKHATPCGAAIGSTLDEAYARALDSDPVSAFGGVIAVNRRVGAGACAARIAEQLSRCCSPPASRRRRCHPPRQSRTCGSWTTASGARPALASATSARAGRPPVQDRDTELDDRDNMQVVTTAAPTRRHGATCCSPGGSASTCARTRSCWPATWPRWASAPAR